MAVIKREDAAQLVDLIRKSTRTGLSVLFLAAPSVDSLCSLKILTTLLAAEFIPFKVEPVSSYGEVQRLNVELGREGYPGVSTIVLVECGATSDLSKLLTPPSRVQIFVLDSHRPIALENLYGNSQVLFLDDDYVRENENALKDLYEATLLSEPEDDAFSSSEPESDSEVENKDPREEFEGKKKMSNRQKQRLRDNLATYYEVSWTSSPSSRLALEIADAFHKLDNSVLWLGIMGCLESYLLDNIETEDYLILYDFLKGHCARLNPDASAVTNSQSSISLGSSPSEATSPIVLVKTGSREGRIKTENEFRFLLMRHWNIQDSMRHSRYIVGRLQTWRDRGKRRLAELFAAMGIPLDACQKDYLVMSSKFKREFGHKLQKFSESYGLQDVRYPSFVREFGYEMTLAASDVVYAISALMEKPVIVENGVSDIMLWRTNFPVAFSAVSDAGGFKLIRQGIDLAIKQHKVFVHEVNSVLNHRLIRYGRRFRYAVLRNGSDLAWFTSPHALIKLAQFLVDAERNTRKGHTPLLMAAYQAHSDTFLAVGVNCDDTQGNYFGTAFRSAAEEIHARVRHDGFDSTLIEVANDDLKPFIMTLQRYI